jgi:hypothetical protein
MLRNRRFRSAIAATTLVLLATACGSSAQTAVRVGADQTATSTSEPSTTTSKAPAMPRLMSPVTLDNDLLLVPPLATDTTTLNAADILRTFHGQLAGQFNSPPSVFLARYTDRGLQKARADEGIPDSPRDPTDRLVVAIVGFGITFPAGGAGGMHGPVTTVPGTPDGQTIFWTLDPVTGGALWGTNFPGALPDIPTSS